MRWVSAVLGGVVVALALTAWPEMSFIVTTYGGEGQSPSEFQMWWMESTRWLVVALGVLTIASGATTRRDVLGPLAVLLMPQG
jgi:hypothetical protein